MWCPSCRQDVPGLVDELDGHYGCPRCGSALASDAGLDLSSAEDVERLLRPKKPEPPAIGNDEMVFESLDERPAQSTRVTTLRWDAANWELNEKLRHVERVTASSRLRRDPPSPVATGSHVPWAQPLTHSYGPSSYSPSWSPSGYAAPPYPNNPYIAPPPSPAPPPPSQYERNSGRLEIGRLIGSLVSWLFLGGAITGFSCGGFLAAWGAIAQRPNLQQLGMPIILLGVVSLVVGLLPQIFLRRLEELDREAARNTAPPQHAPYYPTLRAESTYRA